MKKLLILAPLFFLFSCGTDQSLPQPGGDNLIYVEGFSFVPDTIKMGAGETLFFYNQSDNVLRIVSQSGTNAFDDTGSFDSSDIVPGEASFITIPATANPGDTFFFYDFYLTDTFVNPTGVIQVE